MGNYCEIVENKLEVQKTDEITCYRLKGLLRNEEAKFYGYWTEDYLKELASYGKNGTLKGQIIIEYEDIPKNILCKWDEEGFHYVLGEIYFDGSTMITVGERECQK